MGMLVFVALAFGALVYAFVTSDFSIADVANNSHTLKPLIYKITGVWGNHEGSMLLWVLVLSLYAGAVAGLQRGGERLTSAALGVQGLLAAAFLLFILFTSNPFLRLDPAPFEGAGLNPLLQDPGLAIHPPMLYAGYVGLSASFSYAAAALIVGEDGWARAARPFMLIAWIALTCGIALGSWWAYYELGWGGFWFWDPVENASLMPWLVATALAAFGAGDGEERRLPHLDFAAGHRRLFAEPDRHLPGALGRAVVGACLRLRSHARLFHYGADRCCAIGGALALVRLARAHAARRRGLRHGEPRKRAAAQQCVSGGSCAAVFVGTLYPLALDALAMASRRFPSARLITRSPSRRSFSRCCCWCRSGRSWAGGAAILRPALRAPGACVGPCRRRGAWRCWRCTARAR